MPPMVQWLPGSTGKNSPWSRRWSLSCCRVTPGSIRQSMSSGLTSWIATMRDRSSEMPCRTGFTWPSRLVPAPKAVTGTPCWWQSATSRLTSSVVSAKATASGSVRRRLVLAAAVLLPHRLRRGQAFAENLAGGGDDRVHRSRGDGVHGVSLPCPGCPVGLPPTHRRRRLPDRSGPARASRSGRYLRPAPAGGEEADSCLAVGVASWPIARRAAQSEASPPAPTALPPRRGVHAPVVARR